MCRGSPWWGGGRTDETHLYQSREIGVLARGESLHISVREPTVAVEVLDHSVTVGIRWVTDPAPPWQGASTWGLAPDSNRQISRGNEVPLVVFELEAPDVERVPVELLRGRELDRDQGDISCRSLYSVPTVITLTAEPVGAVAPAESAELHPEFSVRRLPRHVGVGGSRDTHPDGVVSYSTGEIRQYHRYM